MELRYIDIGTNLFSEQFDGKREEIMERAAEAGTLAVITGSSHRSSLQAAEYVRVHGGYCTAGIHPHAAKEADEAVMSDIRRLIDEPFVAAVGECGLDYDRMFSPADVQREVFGQHLRIAEETDKPLFLHERAAHEDFVRILSAHPVLCRRAVVHCFTGDEKSAVRYLELGCMIGITGWICDDRRNADLLRAIKEIPADRLMAETDAPYLTPRIKGLRNPNVPLNISYVVSRIAKEKDMDEEELRVKILDNTKRFFGIG
ncbi:MAG: TatD family hydrolase [Oscillospiraceae bacterium]|nr:TatD family hydrolase [Oscillospiraceae bacterium]